MNETSNNRDYSKLTQIKGGRLGYALILLFTLLLVVHVAIGEFYIESSEENFMVSIKNIINTMIDKKKTITFDIAEIIAHDSDVIRTMEHKEYRRLAEEHLLNITKDYRTFKHIGIYIIDKNGRYLHIDINAQKVKNSLTDELKNIITEVVKKNAAGVNATFKGILLTKSDLVFDAIVPIRSLNGVLLGFVEVITHFNSIAKQLEKEGIDSAVVVRKKFSSIITHPFTKRFVKGYYIALLHLKPDVLKILEKSKMEEFLDNDLYDYAVPAGHFVTGYYITSVPIRDFKNRTVAYYLAFIYDRYGLAIKETMMHISVIALLIVFAITAFFMYKFRKANMNLIRTLDKRVKQETLKRLRLLYTDPVTGAYSLAKYETDIRSAPKESYTVMFNIKNFSKINAVYGFEIGDKVLRIVVERITSIIGDRPYRIHADEFVFIATECKSKIKQIRNEFLKNPISIERIDVKLRLSFSFGVCKNDQSDILSKASTAVRQAKLEPYREFVFYTPQEIDRSFIRYNAILYDAIFHHEEAELVPYFQGIMDNKTKRMYKFESLARIITGDKVLSPFAFLDVAKSSGFVYEMTRIIIEKSIEKLAKAPDEIELSINITEDDLNSGQLKEHLKALLDKYGIAPERITLEILEGITSTGTKNNIAKLKELKAMGIKIAIDDFGVQYSNFERIAELDIDCIKIDGKYIKGLTISDKYRKIVKTITDFAHSVGIEVVAEFVENEEIQQVVLQMGIDSSQGYLFSKPSKELPPRRPD